MRALLAILTLCSTSVHAQDTLLNHVRKNVGEMFKTEAVCTSIYEVFESTDYKDDNMLLGYHGATLIGMTRHDGNVFKKMSYFNDGKKLLEKSIDVDHDNVELRFLRLTIQTHMPSFLGYSENKESDKAFVLNHLEETKSESFKTKVRNFIKHAEEQGKL